MPDDRAAGPGGRKKKKRDLPFYTRLLASGAAPLGSYVAKRLGNKYALPAFIGAGRDLYYENGVGPETERQRAMLARARVLMPDVKFYGLGDKAPPDYVLADADLGGQSYYHAYANGGPRIYSGIPREAVLAHEMGHHLNHKSLQSLFGKPLALGLDLLNNLPVAYGGLGSLAAFALGGRTGREWAWTLPLIISAPRLADEGMASIRGWRYAPALGMKPEDAATGKMELLKAFGSYALPVAGSSLGLYLAHRLLDGSEEETEEEKAKKKKKEPAGGRAETGGKKNNGLPRPRSLVQSQL